ncbi:MAG: YebC/PmpR family DNA-binding transcriptional regulator [Candidatus Margulisiibacteriota bacterium]|jgi:YebC/PmpR family DNA-binding regulatory protein
MSGHNKWSSIKHKKGKNDAQRGKIFTKIIREIQSSVRSGNSGDPESNARLRLAIAKAKDANMPADNIKKAIQKALGADGGVILEEVNYEGYGPGGVAIMVDCLTDNKNRTLPVIRNIIGKGGGNLGSLGSVSYLFKQNGQFIFAPGTDENKVMEIAIDAGAEDVNTNDDGSIEVYCEPNQFEGLREAFEKAAVKFENAEVTMTPATYVSLDPENSEKLQKMIDSLEEEDDVQNVYTNVESNDQ